MGYYGKGEVVVVVERSYDFRQVAEDESKKLERGMNISGDVNLGSNSEGREIIILSKPTRQMDDEDCSILGSIASSNVRCCFLQFHPGITIMAIVILDVFYV